MRRRSLLQCALGCVLVLLLSAFAFGQQEENVSVGPVIRNEVQVLATVRDKSGKIVNDLKVTDFTVDEEGRSQALSSFTARDNSPLTLGLLVDTNPGQRKAVEQERAATGKFVDGLLREDKDSGFVIHFDREVELLQDVTKSHQQLDSALAGIQALQVEDRGQRGEGSGRDEGGGYPDSDSRGRGQGRGGERFHGPKKLLYDSIYLAGDEVLKKQQWRKAIVVVSDGVDRGSKSSIEEAIESAQRSDSVVYTVYFEGEKVNTGEHGRWGQGRVSGPWGRPGGGYPGGGYPGQGGGRSPEPEEPKADGRKVLERIAKETGGRMFEASKKQTLEQIFQKIQEELTNQYLLAFKPNRSEDDIKDYHKIQLTTNNKDLVVQARDGYYAPVSLDGGKDAK